eukprot:1988639-Pyramimonas_sp.AAC.1
MPQELLAGSIKARSCEMNGQRYMVDTIQGAATMDALHHSAVAKSDETSFVGMLRCMIAGGISSYPVGALDLLKSGKPEQSSLRHAAGSSSKRRPRVADKNRK